MRSPVAHRVTTAHLQAAYPFVAEGGLGCDRVYVGRDLFGSSFTFDPWQLYGRRMLTGINMVVLGMIGRGKSSFLKTLLLRNVLHGIKGVVFDVKGEYGALAQALGVTPLRLAPGGDVRLNPLDPRSPERSQTELLEAIGATALSRVLRPEERAALELALSAARLKAKAAGREPVLPDVVAALLEPDGAGAQSLSTTPEALAAGGREVALELRRLCLGSLRGMFDGPTSAQADFASPLVVIDLSAVYHSDALPIVMTCVAAWLQAALGADEVTRRIVVVDEAWRMMSSLPVAQWMQACFKLARTSGTMNVLALHRLSDLGAAGAAGSHQARLAEGLLADAETRVIYAQAPSEVASAKELLGLTDTEAAILPNLPRGQALWKVGSRSFLVEHRISDYEAALVDTDARMSTGASFPPVR